MQRTLRWQGYRRALQEAARSSVQVRTNCLSMSDIGIWTDDPARAAAYFGQPDAPTAVMAWNDYEAIRLFSALQQAGIKIPETLSLAGYDALPEGELIHPPLTTVDHAIGQQLQAALNLLTQSEPLSPSHTVIVSPTLIRRESTAPPTRAG